MPHIKVNFDEVPDKIPPIPAGEYTLLVESVEDEETKKGGQMLAVSLKVDDDTNPNHGRQVRDWIAYRDPNGKPNKMGEVSMRRIAKSAGLVVGNSGLNTEDLIGKHVKARVKNSTFTDKESGELVENSKIAEYLFTS